MRFCELCLCVHAVVCAGNAGAAALFEQTYIEYGVGTPEAERRTYTSRIHHIVIAAMRTLCQQSEQYGQVAAHVLPAKSMVENELKVSAAL